MLWLLAVIIGGAVFEWILVQQMLGTNFAAIPEPAATLTMMDRLKTGCICELLNCVGICLFIGFSYILFLLLGPGEDMPAARLVFLATLLTVTLIRAGGIVSRLLFSPRIATIRPLPLDDHSALIGHRLTVATFGYTVAVLFFTVVTHRLGAEPSSILLLQLFFASLLLLGSTIGILFMKNRIRERIMIGFDKMTQEAGWARRTFAEIWHLLAIFYLGLLWLLIAADLASPGDGNNSAFFISIFIVPLWMATDRVVQWLVLLGAQTLKIHWEQPDGLGIVDEETAAAREKSRGAYLKAQRIARVVLAIALGVWIAGLWEYKIPFLSTMVAVLRDTLLITAVALFFWRFVNSWIEKRIEESLPSDGENLHLDDEWGSAAAKGRSYTLLPMIRKFIASILVVLVLMTILSSLGVNIGPLMAGAGVVGLAVGFGAQKLVADMFSGFFYLLDDAFRVGEYITAGAVSGTVESITLRNVMVRHHRGMLMIVPHSQLGAITNFMRGGIIVKFNLSFAYDADIEQIRKIVKKIGLEMLEDQELGKDFIRPLKSQGIRDISDSVMTIRVKFTAKPGSHFIIRREAYRRITEALNGKGIHYAHRKVIVDVSGLTGAADQSPVTERMTAVAKAAGAAAMVDRTSKEKQAKTAEEGENT